MNFVNLKLFKEIASQKNLSRAAEELHVGQSAVSQQLQELERELNVKLVDRTKRPIELTDAGDIFAGFCRQVLLEREELEATLAALRQESGGTVRVASIYSIGLSEMAQLEQEFRKRRPHAKLAVEYLRPEKVYAAVEAGEADLGLVSYAQSTRAVTALPWRKEEMVLAAAPDHPLSKKAAALAGPLPLAELSGADFVSFDDDLPIRTAVDKFLRERDIEVREVAHFDNIETIKEAVALKVGVSILPARVFREEVRQRRLTAIRLSGVELYRPLGIIHRKRSKFRGATQAFLELLRG